MSTMSLPSQMPATSDALCRMFIPRPIRNETQLRKVARVIDRLAVLDKPTRSQRDYLEVLATLVEAYESRRCEIDTPGVTPIEALKFLMAENDMTGSDLGRLLGQRQLGAQILSGRRQLSKAHIRKLAGHFNVRADLFLA